MPDIIFTMSKDEFKESLAETIREELTQLLPHDLQTDELLNMKDIMEILRISKPTVYSYLEKGLIKSYKIEGRRFFLKSELIEMLKQQKDEY